MPHDAEKNLKPLKKRCLKGNATAVFLCEGKECAAGKTNFCDAGIHLNSQDLLEHIVENNLTPS